MKTRKIIKFIIFAASILYVARFFYKNWDTVEIGFDFNKLIIAAILLLSFTGLITYSYRFKVILDKCAGKSPPLWKWFRIIILGRFLNLIFSQTGNLYRGIELKRNYGISYTNYISAFVSFIWMDLGFNLIISELIILIFDPEIKIYDWYMAHIIVLLIMFLVVSPIIAKAILQRFSFKGKWPAWLTAKLTEVLSVTFSNLRDMRYMVKFILLGFLILIQTLVAYSLLFKCFQIELDFAALIIFYTLLKFSTFVVITPGNIGVQEIAFGFLAEQLGIGMAQGMLVSLAERVLGTIIIILLGVFFGGIDLLGHRKDLLESTSAD